MPIRAVFFDVGETLLDESRDWGEWADFLGVSRLALFAALGAVIERGLPHRAVFGIVRPGSSFADLSRDRAAAGRAYAPTPTDFYPDAIACLAQLRAAGLYLGIAGNQPAATAQALRTLGVPADLVASSEEWGVEKPDPAFFARMIAATPGWRADEIAYVGDRLDNDIAPALRAGMRAIFLRRGPWALAQSTSGRFAPPPIVIDDLRALPDLLLRA